jgi:hypothetical protein
LGRSGWSRHRLGWHGRYGRSPDRTLT